MDEFWLKIIETFIGTVIGGTITLIFSTKLMNRQIIIERDMKMAQDLVEVLEIIKKTITSMKFKLKKEMENKTEEINYDFSIAQVKDTLYILGEMIIEISSKFKRNQILLYKFEQTFSSFISQYNSSKKLIKKMQKNIEINNQNYETLKLECQNIDDLFNDMRMNINVLILDLQNEFIYRIYNRKVNNYIKRNSENTKLDT